MWTKSLQVNDASIKTDKEKHYSINLKKLSLKYKVKMVGKKVH
jgi:hypothetical protein